MNNINDLYTIQHVKGTSPKRYQVMFGSIPMSRPMDKKSAEQWLMLQTGELGMGRIDVTWSGTNSR